MIKGSYIKKIFIVVLLLSIFVQNTGCVREKEDNSKENNYEPIAVVHMQGGPGYDSSTFVLYSDNKLKITYGSREMLTEHSQLYTLDETGGFGSNIDVYKRKVRQKDRNKIDEIVESIRKDCFTHEKLNFEDESGPHIIYCNIGGKTYCARYSRVKRADDLIKYDLNYQVLQLVYEFLKYAPIIKIDEQDSRYGDGSYRASNIPPSAGGIWDFRRARGRFEVW